MWQVLVRPTGSFPRTRSHSFTTAALCAILFAIDCIRVVSAQGFINNGQFFTAGLAIGDAPQPGSTQHAGSDLVLAIDLSGDGKIPQSAFQPGSSMATRYNSLELYLVSAQMNINLTVSNGPGLLTQEPGSTVKHLNWPIPPCVPAGDYNVTYYEGSTINSQDFFSITPLPITIQNAGGGGGACAGNNPVQTQPQPASPPSSNPDVSPGFSLSTGVGIPTFNPASPTIATGIITVTLGPSGLPTNEQVTVTVSPSEVLTTATIVMVSVQTLTTTPPGETNGIATTRTSMTTMTTIVATGALTADGFLPVNGALAAAQPLPFLLGLSSSICFILLFSRVL